jgi:Flp pilus assembly protein TadD
MGSRKRHYRPGARSAIVAGLLAAVACGGGAKEHPGAGRPPAAADGQSKPEDFHNTFEGDGYSFYRSVARTLLRTNQPLQAARTIRRLFKLKPESPEPHVLMARAYLAMDQLDAARKMLLGAIEKDETYAEAHAVLGMVLNNMGQHRLADASHRKAIALDGENASYRNNLGFSFYLQGRYRQAVAEYRKALELDPGARRFHNNLGFALGKLGKMKEALQHFELAGVPAQARNNLGFVYESRGELEKAYDMYREALDADPALRQARRNLSRMCERLGRPVPDFDVSIDSKEADGETPPES